jgi:RNA polymerase-binding protein DksA
MNSQLTGTQIHQLKTLLEDQFNKLWKEIGSELNESDKEHFMQISGEVHDLEDSSIADLFTDLNITLLDRHVQETRDINSALIRINKGTFGVCIDCGEPIGYDRLMAYPTAIRCIRCEEVYENTHAGNPHPKL